MCFAVAVIAFGPLQQSAVAAGNQAFSISPPLVSTSANPGQTVTVAIRFTNLSADTLLITPSANDFGAKDEDGNPQVALGDKNLPTGLRHWVQLPVPFRLDSKQTKVLAVPIAVPKDASPGGHYGVIRFGGQPPEASGNSISFSASLGTLLLLTVSGKVEQKASLSDFYSATGVTGAPSTKKSFFEHGPLKLVTRVSNDGNVHLQPTGTVTIADTFGRTIATQRVNGAPKDAKNPPKNVLPKSVRRFENLIETKHLFGRYTAHLDLAYGDNHKRLAATTSFWVVPYKLLAGAVLGLVAIVGMIWIVSKKYKITLIKKRKK